LSGRQGLRGRPPAIRIDRRRRHGGVRASPGACTIVARKFGYQDATTNLTVGIATTPPVNLTLVALPTTTFTGRVVDAGTLAGLEGAE